MGRSDIPTPINREACRQPLKRGPPFQLAQTIFVFAILGSILAHIGTGQANTTQITESGLTDALVQSSITANMLKPAECAGLDLTRIVNGSGTFSGTPENDLITGSVGIDTVDGLGGNDCILGGDQGDQLFGGPSSEPETVRDEFNTIAYNNNDGTQNWNGDWIEIGESDGPVNGDVNVEVPLGRGKYSVYADQDTWIEERDPTRNYGIINELKVKPSIDDNKRALYRFNLASIPGSSNVVSATVYFWVNTANNNPVSIHRVTNNWTETGATWGNISSAFDPAPAASFTPATANQFVSANITSLVQQWVNASAANNGLMLIASASAAETKYASREDGNPARHPYLTILLSPGGAVQAMRIQNASHGAYRLVNLCNAISATLQFNYLRQELDDANDYVAVQVSNTGGDPWTEIGRFSGPLNDTQMQPATYDITDFISCTTAIRFISSPSLGPSDKVYLDDVKITYMDISSVGNDVLIGGPGGDFLDGGNGTDTCYGGSGTDTYINCENIIEP